jgi:hypothetical protein
MSHGRHLMASTAEEFAGMQVSLYWWITAFQAVIAVFALLVAFAGKLRAQTNIYMAINSALLAYMVRAGAHPLPALPTLCLVPGAWSMHRGVPTRQHTLRARPALHSAHAMHADAHRVLVCAGMLSAGIRLVAAAAC